MSQGCGAVGSIIPTASQPATPSFWRERCCPALPVATGWTWRIGLGLCWRGCQEHCPELSEWLRGCPVTCGWWCRVLADPPRAGSLTAARGALLPVVFLSRLCFSSPLASLLSVPGQSCSTTFCLPEALPLRRLNLPPSLGR